jgi:hypothetical protein
LGVRVHFFEQSFKDRIQEIDAYLDFLHDIEVEIKTSGAPKMRHGGVVTPMQQKVLYSNVYLHLYNLTESTINKICDDLTKEITKDEKWYPVDLSDSIRDEWIKFYLKANENLNKQNSLKGSQKMFEHLTSGSPLQNWEISKGGGGNWHDEDIYDFSKRLGCDLNLTPEINRSIKSPIRDNKGALKLITKLRNDLAHGNISFGECGNGIDVSFLRDLRNRVVIFLQAVIDAFKNFIANYLYLKVEKRPI